MENGQTTDLQVKVLVVDDHPNTAHMLARAISRLGPNVNVVSATSGLEALQHMDDGPVDILITDMMMPEMTGMELIETLGGKPSISPSVTFLLTAHDSSGVREIADRLNVKEVISKPAHPEQICELVLRTMNELKESKLGEAEKGSGQPADPYTAQDELNISQLLWEVAKKFQPQADLKNQLLVVGETDSSLRVLGNIMKLRQALRTLVWSAIQNTPNGGSVILSSKNGSDKIRVLVRDTGYGNIESETYNRDLETVKTIAEGHGGDVTVESEVGKGTCFTLSLPLFQTENLLVENHSSTENEIRSS
jgi:CheY-like chemotaxis protein